MPASEAHRLDTRLSIRFDHKGTGRDDVVLQVGDTSLRTHSRYFAADQQLRPGEADAAKVKAVLLRLLSRWTEAIDSLADGESVYLPFGFLDGGTEWLHVRRVGGDVELIVGLSKSAGSTLPPSPFPRVQPTGFSTARADSSIRLPLADCVRAIWMSMVALEH